MVSFICPICGQKRTAKIRRCYPCTKTILSQESREMISETLKGRKHSDERKRNISEGKKRQIAADGNVFDLAGYMRTQPHPFASPVGEESVDEENGRVFVKCSDGKWRRRSHVVWAAANGRPIPPKYIIHHIDHDPSNDELDNLQLVTRSEHARIHNTPEVARRRQKLAIKKRKENAIKYRNGKY